MFGGYVIWTNYTQAREGWNTRGFGAPKPPLYGIWTQAMWKFGNRVIG